MKTLKTESKKIKNMKYFFKFIYLFWERERETVQVGEGQRRERGRENPKQTLCCQRRAQCRVQTHETVRSWHELKPRVWHLTNWATQVPLKYFLITGKSKVNHKHSILSTSDIKSFMHLQYLLNIDLTKNCCKNVFGGRSSTMVKRLEKSLPTKKITKTKMAK